MHCTKVRQEIAQGPSWCRSLCRWVEETNSSLKGRHLTHPGTEERRDICTHRLLGHVCKESGELWHRGNLNASILHGSHKKESGRCQGNLFRKRTELSFREVGIGRGPVIVDQPQRLASESRKREPIVEFVFLKVGEGNKQKSC